MAKTRRTAGALLCAALALGLLATACAAGEEAGRAPVQIMKVSDVRSGMKGYGLSTFEGTRVEKFDVEVLAVVRGWSAGGSAVLVKLAGPVVNQAGTVMGMSGSPIYIDDKLLGAVAFGFRFCKIPLAGVTPAEEMLVVRDIDRRDGGGGRAERKAAAREILRQKSSTLLDDMRSGKVQGAALTGRLAELAAPLCMTRRLPAYRLDEMPPRVRMMLEGTGAEAMAPLPIPIAVGGVGAEAYGMLSPMFQAGGFIPVQAAQGAAGGEGGELRVEPGAAMGAVFVSGDADIAGLGTITLVDGDRVLAFGHSMFGTGDSDFPLAVGRVQTVVPSLSFSFRISSAEKVVGRITQDREAAIAGRLGQNAPMFPCTVRVKGVEDRTFHYQVAGYWETAPMLTSMAMLISAVRWEGEQNLMTVTATSRITLKDQKEPIVISNTYATRSVVMPIVAQVAIPMQALVLNQFRDVEIAGVEMDMEVQKGLRAAEVESVRADRTEAEPGQKVTLVVGLKEFHGGQVSRTIEVQVPKDAQPGTMASITVCDSDVTLVQRVVQDPGFFQPRDFKGLVDAIKLVPSATKLYVHSSFQKRGLRYGGDAMPQLPSSVTNMLVFGTEVGMAAPLVEDARMEVEMPWVVTGHEQISVLIKEPREKR